MHVKFHKLVRFGLTNGRDGEVEMQLGRLPFAGLELPLDVHHLDHV